MAASNFYILSAGARKSIHTIHVTLFKLHHTIKYQWQMVTATFVRSMLLYAAATCATENIDIKKPPFST
jgi:hypothetical protein